MMYLHHKHHEGSSHTSKQIKQPRKTNQKKVEQQHKGLALATNAYQQVVHQQTTAVHRDNSKARANSSSAE
jgi:hypothetical protein